MLTIVFITQMLFIAIFLSAILSDRSDKKKLKQLQEEFEQLQTKPTYSEGFRDGEYEALKNHKKVLEAYRYLFPNAK